MLEEYKMPQAFWEDAAIMAIHVINRTSNRYEGRWQREATYLMFGINTDYSRFTAIFKSLRDKNTTRIKKGLEEERL